MTRPPQPMITGLTDTEHTGTALMLDSTLEPDNRSATLEYEEKNTSGPLVSPWLCGLVISERPAASKPKAFFQPSCV